MFVGFVRGGLTQCVHQNIGNISIHSIHFTKKILLIHATQQKLSVSIFPVYWSDVQMVTWFVFYVLSGYSAPKFFRKTQSLLTTTFHVCQSEVFRLHSLLHSKVWICIWISMQKKSDYCLLIVLMLPGLRELYKKVNNTFLRINACLCFYDR